MTENKSTLSVVGEKIKNAPMWAKAVTLLGITAAGFGYANREDIVSPPKVHSGAELSAKKQGDEVATTFVVESSHVTYDGKVLLNSMKDFSSPECITAVASTSQVPDAKGVVGKSVTVKGKKTRYKNKKTGKESDQIQVTEIVIK
jgi:hypothetical protein